MDFAFIIALIIAYALTAVGAVLLGHWAYSRMRANQ